MTDGLPRPASLPAGYDEEDPYEEEDLSKYPEWWRRNIEEFERHGMRPYRPPRFEDGELVPPLVTDLEAKLGVDIRIRSVNPQEEGGWELRVSDNRVATLTRNRETGGYTRYRLSASEFESIVTDAVDEGEMDEPPTG
jgi:hypothetical protein